MNSSRLKILLSVYACEPDKGSEPGVGWNWALQLSRFHEIWAMTRRNNQEAIERAMAEAPSPNLHWIYFDLPPWSRFWKRGHRGVHVYYYLWQMGVYSLARRLHREVGFDLVHHLTFGNYWMPSFLTFLPVPFVWGPVGGGETPPGTFYPTLAPSARVYEYLRNAARWLGEKNPFVRFDARRSLITLSKTAQTAERVRLLGGRRVELYSEAGISEDELRQLGALPFRDSPPFRLVSIGRLQAFKGFHLGLAAFARLQRRFPSSEYYVIGDGPERQRLERLVRRLRIAHKVFFLGKLPRAQVLAVLDNCDALVHPSLHDSGGWVCLEAMAAGRPVVCLDLGGPRLQVTKDTGFKVPANDPKQTVHGLSAAMLQLSLSRDLRVAMGEAGRKRVRELFTWSRKAAALAQFYEGLVSREQAASGSVYNLWAPDDILSHHSESV